MKYPKLVPSKVCKTPINLRIDSDEIGEYGESECLVNLDTTCNFQSSSKRIYTSQDTYIQLTATALFDGDIVSTEGNISSGTATVFGREYRIYSISKLRNPDGTVNYTKVELI